MGSRNEEDDLVLQKRWGNKVKLRIKHPFAYSLVCCILFKYSKIHDPFLKTMLDLPLFLLN